MQYCLENKLINKSVYLELKEHTDLLLNKTNANLSEIFTVLELCRPQLFVSTEAYPLCRKQQGSI